jgi:Papain-like cysteine protease AvrRpt2
MNVPDVLSPLNDLAPPSRPADMLSEGSGGGGASGEPPPFDSLANFAVPHQQQVNWCWAAVTLGVESFFNPATTSTQCDIANVALGRRDCCPARTGNPCDRTWYLDRTLINVGHLASQSPTPSDFGTVRNQIAAKVPLCCRIGWAGPEDGGHFVALSGWSIDDNGTQYVDVNDPFYDFNQPTFADFCSSYQTSGSWTDSYFTS